MAAPPPPSVQDSVKGDASEQPKYWPATPTPSGCQNMMYGFGENMPPPMGLPLQPPPMLAAMAAAAAGAAGAAAAAASASLGGADGGSLDASPSGPEATAEQAYGSPSLVPPAHPGMQLPPDGAAPQSLPSRGSALHGTGKCRPCAWFWKAQGCQNDLDCGYCHLCPEGELRSRKKSKVAAMRMGALAPAKPGSTSGLIRTLKLTPLV